MRDLTQLMDRRGLWRRELQPTRRSGGRGGYRGAITVGVAT
jgi:hypothetical protein